MKDPCINIKYSSSSSHITSIISTSLIFELILPWSICKSVLCHEISVQQTVCGIVHFIDVVEIFHTSKICVYTFDLISSSVEFLVTKKKHWQKLLVSCFLVAILKANYEELHFIKDSWDCFSLAVRYRRYRRQDWTLPAVPETGRRYRKSYSAMDTTADTAGTITVIWEPGLKVRDSDRSECVVSFSNLMSFEKHLNLSYHNHQV